MSDSFFVAFMRLLVALPKKAKHHETILLFENQHFDGMAGFCHGRSSLLSDRRTNSQSVGLSGIHRLWLQIRDRSSTRGAGLHVAVQCLLPTGRRCLSCGVDGQHPVRAFERWLHLFPLSHHHTPRKKTHLSK